MSEYNSECNNFFQNDMNQGSAATSIIYCPTQFFLTHILKLLTMTHTFKLYEKIRSKVIRCSFQGLQHIACIRIKDWKHLISTSCILAVWDAEDILSQNGPLHHIGMQDQIKTKTIINFRAFMTQLVHFSTRKLKNYFHHPLGQVYYSCCSRSLLKLCNSQIKTPKTLYMLLFND